MNALERIWAAMPSDGVMKPETMYGWTTSDQIDEWRNESDNTSDNGDLLVYFEYIRADVAADMVAAALREAAGILQNRANGARIAQWDAEERKHNEIAAAILALIPCKDTAELALGKDDAK